MCGILAILDRSAISDEDLKLLVKLIDVRGPDYSSEIVECNTRCGDTLKFKSSVLHFRGSKLQKQPQTDNNGNILLLNGQIYAFNGLPLEPTSDTQYLSHELSLLSSSEQVASCLLRLTGPFSIIYWSDVLQCLFFGRDFFGRKSLCVLGHLNRPSILASVAIKNTDKNQIWTELDCSSIYCLCLNGEPKLTRYLRNIDSIYPKTSKCQACSVDECETVLLNQQLSLKNSLNSQVEYKDQSILEEMQKSAVHDFEKYLLDAVSIRINYSRPDCLGCRKQYGQELATTCSHSKVAVAFSGGVDSTILALAVDNVLAKEETIDLVTVAFRDNSPDRASVAQAIIELIKLRPARKWRLVLGDISIPELKAERSCIIKHLIAPCETVVDDSLGCAGYFIGRAKGRALDSSNINSSSLKEKYEAFCRYNPSRSEENLSLEQVDYDYVSPASMIFVGSGIDEQLGGYSSHRASWSSSGPKGVSEEISFQMRRISTRNMGRDDRVYAHHGRDVKIPYLDENLVSFLNHLPVMLKMDLSKELDTGPKMLIRELARSWGLVDTSKRVKRALQFGTKIANLENTNEKGSDKCARLL